MATICGNGACVVIHGLRTSITTTASTGRSLKATAIFSQPETTGLPPRVLVCHAVCRRGRLTMATVYAVTASGPTVGITSAVTGPESGLAAFGDGESVVRNGLAASKAVVRRAAIATILVISRATMTVKVSFRHADAAMLAGGSTKGTGVTGNAAMFSTVLATSRITRIASAAVRQSKRADKVLSLPVPLMVTDSDSPGLSFPKICLSKSIPQEIILVSRTFQYPMDAGILLWVCCSVFTWT